MKKQKEIIIGVTGGISAYKSCELVRMLQKKGYAVSVLMTKEAAHFVTALTFRTLTQRPVITDMFSEDMEWDPAHISIAEKADLICIVPATANIIAKLACGICDDIISCVVTASKAPKIICPAMNDNMFRHPIVTDNIEKLKGIGYKIVPPVKGTLATGKTGIGHLADMDTIIRAIDKSLP